MDKDLKRKYDIHLSLAKQYKDFLKCTVKHGEKDVKCQNKWKNWWFSYHVSKKLMVTEDERTDLRSSGN